MSEPQPACFPRERSRGPTIFLASAAFLAAGFLLWRAFAPGSDSAPQRVWQEGYPSPPPSGYYILLPAAAEPAGEFMARVTALTNLPEGTLLEITTTNDGMCCLPVEDSKIVFTTQDSSCYGFVGQEPGPALFQATIIAKPDFGPWVIPGQGSTEEPQQPEGVVRILGERFENLSGAQVQEQDDGSLWLVSEGTVPWPQPRCGGDPIPEFGGAECDPDDFQRQLQADRLREAIGWVVGTIRSGRMCEFWAVMLEPEVAADHPWPELSAEWRPWLLEQDFSEVEPMGDSILSGVTIGQRGPATIVELVHDGRRIATFEVRPLPDFCLNCDPGTVPFWGVTGWELV